MIPAQARCNVITKENDIYLFEMRRRGGTGRKRVASLLLGDSEERQRERERNGSMTNLRIK